MAEKQRPDEEPEADAATEAAAAPDAEAPEETPAAEAATAEEAVEEPVAEASAGDDAASEPEAEAAAQPKPRRSRAKKADKAEGEPAEEKPAPKRKAPAKKKPAAGKAEEEPAAEEKPAARPQRPAGQRPVVRAQAKYVRTSARKARLVCDHIRGKSVDEARAILAHVPRAVSQDWSKLLESAVANAEHNHELVGDDLKIHAVFADEGPTIKRYRPRAMGRATPIRKRTSHLTIQLTVKE